MSTLCRGPTGKGQAFFSLSFPPQPKTLPIFSGGFLVGNIFIFLCFVAFFVFSYGIVPA